MKISLALMGGLLSLSACMPGGSEQDEARAPEKQRVDREGKIVLTLQERQALDLR